MTYGETVSHCRGNLLEQITIYPDRPQWVYKTPASFLLDNKDVRYCLATAARNVQLQPFALAATSLGGIICICKRLNEKHCTYITPREYSYMRSLSPRHASSQRDEHTRLHIATPFFPLLLSLSLSLTFLWSGCCCWCCGGCGKDPPFTNFDILLRFLAPCRSTYAPNYHPANTAALTLCVTLVLVTHCKKHLIPARSSCRDY